MEKRSSGFHAHLDDDAFVEELITDLKSLRTYFLNDQFTGRTDLLGKIESALLTQGRIDAIDAVINRIIIYKNAGQA